ncbi:MAG: MobA/MobL family protein, partial [Chloroflexota bacterium]
MQQIHEHGPGFDRQRRALEREGFEQRVDRRSLEDQGIDREPQIHVGPAAERLRQRGVEL